MKKRDKDAALVTSDSGEPPSPPETQLHLPFPHLRTLRTTDYDYEPSSEAFRQFLGALRVRQHDGCALWRLEVVKCWMGGTSAAKGTQAMKAVVAGVLKDLREVVGEGGVVVGSQ